MKSTYDNKLEALQKDLDTERAERKKLEDQLRMARYWKKKSTQMKNQTIGNQFELTSHSI